MRIERINDLSEILKCLPFEREIRNKGRERIRESDMLMFIRNQLGNPLFGVWIAYGDDDNEVKGYTFAMLNIAKGFEREYIIRMYAKEKELRNNLFDILAQWAKEYKVKLQQVTVIKNIKAVQRTFKFRPVSVNMERRI